MWPVWAIFKVLGNRFANKSSQNRLFTFGQVWKKSINVNLLCILFRQHLETFGQLFKSSIWSHWLSGTFKNRPIWSHWTDTRHFTLHTTFQLVGRLNPWKVIWQLPSGDMSPRQMSLSRTQSFCLKSANPGLFLFFPSFHMTSIAQIAYNLKV